MVFLAGPIAEGILLGRCKFGDIFPSSNISESHTNANRKFNKLFWKMIFVDTKLLIYAPWNWQAVIALSDELLVQKKIRYQAARKIMRQAIEDYREGVRNGISALHYTGYSDFVKQVDDAKVKFKKG